MEGPDYHLALLVQRQLEHESNYGTDLYLAQKLQDDFNKEIITETANGLTYDHKNKPKEDGRSLIDPSWELIDPTPDIHNLFVVFNQRFFWTKLLTVCVSWSRRMTSCAGICSYQGRGGMCSITLSEPLLKLRPRKDLVETLLHEMIHAYLFVTHNNRDRDGHGPEFHKHMYRINKEAGTNITVYHTFHDEVRLYQQHWWRCNGPCQNRKPYFGMVRRATNRAPGPNDRWWGEHLRNCGGTFIKVKEPEAKAKTSKPVLNKSFSGDIRNFITLNNKNTLTNINSTQVTGAGNIHVFTNLNVPQTNVKPISSGNTTRKVNTAGVAMKTKSNSNSTIVINKKFGSKDAGPVTHQPTKVEINAFSGTGKSLSQTGAADSKFNRIDYSAVRNHWANKFPSASSRQINKRNTTTSSPAEISTKKQKMEENPNNTTDTINLDDSFVTCPVCNKRIKEPQLNDHLDLCLLQPQVESEKIQQCFVCNKGIPQSDYRNHIDGCFDNRISDDEELEECEICNIWFNGTKIETHRKSCIENVFGSTQDSLGSSNVSGAATSNVNEKPKSNVSGEPKSNVSDKATSTVVSQCSVCDNFFAEDELNRHTEKCLLKVFDDLDKKYDLNLDRIDEEVSCLVCNKKVLKNGLNAHLDECMSGVFDDKNDFNRPCGSTEGQRECEHGNGVNEKYNCPFCLELYTEFDMSGHLDQCLISDEDSDNRSILIESFSSE